MGLSLGVLSRDTNILQEIFFQISKYANGEIIITDENFNIIFHNTKYIEDKKQCNLYDILNNFMNKNIEESIENFKDSNKNHIFLKLPQNPFEFFLS